MRVNGKRQCNRTMRKRTTHDEDGIKAREIPGTRDRMAWIEWGKKKKQNTREKSNPKRIKSRQKQLLAPTR